MKNTKERNDELISRAYGLFTDKNKQDKLNSKYAAGMFVKDKDAEGKVVMTDFIDDAYSSKIAAFSVSVAMIGLKPTLVMYYEKAGASVDTRNIVGLIAEMLSKDGYPVKNDPAKWLIDYAVVSKPENVESITQDVIDNAVALKVVVRTFLKNQSYE